MVALGGASRAFFVAAASAAAVVSVPASAATVLTNTFDGTTGSYGAKSVAATAGGAGVFTEIFNFTVATAGSVTGSISTTSFGSSTESNIDFDSVVLTGPNNFSKAFTFPTGTGPRVLFEAGSLFASLAQAGTYTLTVNGTTGGNASFGGDFNFTAAAVPEPATWGLMILGFGAVGGAMRRRQSVKARVAFA
jgi:hypothetical protein